MLKLLVSMTWSVARLSAARLPSVRESLACTVVVLPGV